MAAVANNMILTPTPLRREVITHSMSQPMSLSHPIHSLTIESAKCEMYEEKMDNENIIDNSDVYAGELTLDMDSKMDIYEGNPDDDSSGEKSPNCEDGKNSAFRNELKRPDLKGSFRCSICQKVFCHSSSLSRHRMQAHFKSYRCTLCRKEINSQLNILFCSLLFQTSNSILSPFHPTDDISPLFPIFPSPCTSPSPLTS